ncbi:MotA/TolQ/ExbB proton channel family protein [Balneolaceae bacterium ANBcel3]|nr:MotA/TolQ/ExbB proton channel family protein [Balneolaceae bacterium ANBcel3]
MQKTLTKSILVFLCTLSLLFMVSDTNGQELDSIPDITEDITEVDESASELSNIWSLIEQAGPIRYPIYGIFIAGIFMIAYRSYGLMSDRLMEKDLNETSFQHLSLNEISAKISSQSDNMLSVIMAKLLNVFQTNRNADYLHDEISNYNTTQQDNFKTFKNRIDFLSDTAGALGLLGTVWGMFFVFSSGTLEREVILVGMGYALMSTLLGLVVSIILNFCSTFTEGFFSRHLESVTTKADELRFRLIELSEAPNLGKKKSESALTHNNRPSSNSQPYSGKKSKEHETEQNKKPEPVNEPESIKLETDVSSINAGEEHKEVRVQLKGTLGEPVASEKLKIIVDGKGYINSKEGGAIIQTDAKGKALFDWKTDDKIGEKRILVRCNNDRYKDVKSIYSTIVKPAEPSGIHLINNHQAGLVGSKLEKPVEILVKDKYNNPVNDLKVIMKVTMGDGKFENGKKESLMKTDLKGSCKVDFTLGSEPGFNAVDISLPDYKITKSFQAVAQEVEV